MLRRQCLPKSAVNKGQNTHGAARELSSFTTFGQHTAAEWGSEPQADTSAPTWSFLRSLLLSRIRPGSVFRRGHRGCNTHPWPRRYHQGSGRAVPSSRTPRASCRAEQAAPSLGLPIQAGGKQQWDLGRGTHSFLSAASKPLGSCCLLFFLLKEMFWYFESNQIHELVLQKPSLGSQRSTRPKYPQGCRVSVPFGWQALPKKT